MCWKFNIQCIHQPLPIFLINHCWEQNDSRVEIGHNCFVWFIHTHEIIPMMSTHKKNNFLIAVNLFIDHHWSLWFIYLSLLFLLGQHTQGFLWCQMIYNDPKYFRRRENIKNICCLSLPLTFSLSVNWSVSLFLFFLSLFTENSDLLFIYINFFTQ